VTSEVDVVVVGAGPNGLLMSAELALGGLDVLVLERDVEPSETPRARGVVGRAVQALDYRGLFELLTGQRGRPVQNPFYTFGAIHVDLSATRDCGMYIAAVPQRTMEAILAKRGDSLGVATRRGHEVTGMTQDADGVTLAVRSADKAYEIRAQFVVGADGGSSTIRRLCGIEFPGVTDTSFIGRLGNVDSTLLREPGRNELVVPGYGPIRLGYNRTERGNFLLHNFDDDRFGHDAVAAVFEWGDEAVEDRSSDDTEELGRALNRVMGTDVAFGPPITAAPVPLTRVVSHSSRQAERYRAGRVFLVGDAAHVYFPVGGPGLNLGMQDVFNLAWKLAADVLGWAPAGLLDTYESERFPVCTRVLMHSRAQTALMSPGPFVTGLRQVFEELLTYHPDNAQFVAELLSGAQTRYDMGVGGDPHPLVGRWMPDLTLRRRGARGTTRIAELMRDARPLLLDLGDRADLVDASRGWAERMTVTSATVVADEIAEGIDLPEAVLVRPDGFVAWVAGSAGDVEAAGGAGDADGADGLQQALLRWFGPAGDRLGAGRGS
jgi:2-polyprenyl-6-methoxyphenol hydroxylase-like FAD-dependent oxidoreductase